MSGYIIEPGRNRGEAKVPPRGILFINPGDYKICLELLDKKIWQKKFLFNSNLHIISDAFIAGPAIGAPMAVICLEKLIALGALEVLVFGWCGGLLPSDQIGTLVSIDKTVVGEGTSQYYSSRKSGRTSQKLSAELAFILRKNGLEFRQGTCWTTDAPYREKRTHIKMLARDKNIDAIDMEISALVSVVNTRKIELTALFLVSDLPLAANWQAGFRRKDFLVKAENIIKVLLDNFWSNK